MSFSICQIIFSYFCYDCCCPFMLFYYLTISYYKVALISFTARHSMISFNFRSIVEPVRNLAYRQEAQYHFSKAVSLDTDTQTLHCVNALDSGQGEYDVPYDKLVIGVGSRPSTFNVPGVREHAFFLKVPVSFLIFVAYNRLFMYRQFMWQG